MPTPTPPLRGRRGRDRRIAERVASDFAASGTRLRLAKRWTSTSPRSILRSTTSSGARHTEARPTGQTHGLDVGQCEGKLPHRLPDLRRSRRFSPTPGPLPRSSTVWADRPTIRGGSVGAMWAWLRSARGNELLSRRRWPSVRPASVWSGSPATPRSATGWPKNWARWLGDPAAILTPRAAKLTRLRTERALIADETAAPSARPRRLAQLSCPVLVASVQALVQQLIAPDDLPASPRELPPRIADSLPSRCCASCRSRLRAGPRGRRPRAEFPPGAGSSISSRSVAVDYRSDRVSSAMRSIHSAFDPTESTAVAAVDARPGPTPRLGIPLPAGWSSGRSGTPLGRKVGRLPGSAWRRTSPDSIRRCWEARQAVDARALWRSGTPPRSGPPTCAPATGFSITLQPGTMYSCSMNRRDLVEGCRVPVASGGRAPRRARRGRRVPVGLAVRPISGNAIGRPAWFASRTRSS